MSKYPDLHVGHPFGTLSSFHGPRGYLAFLYSFYKFLSVIFFLLLFLKPSFVSRPPSHVSSLPSIVLDPCLHDDKTPYSLPLLRGFRLFRQSHQAPCALFFSPCLSEPEVLGVDCSQLRYQEAKRSACWSRASVTGVSLKTCLSDENSKIEYGARAAMRLY